MATEPASASNLSWGGHNVSLNPKASFLSQSCLLGCGLDFIKLFHKSSRAAGLFHMEISVQGHL